MVDELGRHHCCETEKLPFTKMIITHTSELKMAWDLNAIADLICNIFLVENFLKIILKMDAQAAPKLDVLSALFSCMWVPLC